MARKVYLTPHELSERWSNQISVRTLANWRSDGSRGRKGPPFRKFGARIFYELTAVEVWEKQNEHDYAAED